MSNAQQGHRRYEYHSIAADWDQLNDAGARSWEVITAFPGDETAAAVVLMKRPGLSFQGQVTMEQRRRYFGTWGIDIDTHDPDHLT